MAIYKGASTQNKGNLIGTISEPGVHSVSISPTVKAASVTFERQESGNVAYTSADTDRSQEIIDADTLDNTPVIPGSVSVTGTGVPTLIDRDRDGILYENRTKDQILVTLKTDGVTSAAATKTLTSAGGDFVNAGVRAGDQVHIDNSTDKGIYTIASRDSATQVTITEAWPAGGNTNVSFHIKPVDNNRGAINYFSGAIDLSYPSGDAPAGRGTVLGTGTFPLNLEPAQTLTIDLDGGGAATATFDAGQAASPGNQGATYAASASETLVLAIDSGENQTITFGSGTETTAATYALKINDQITDGVAKVNTDSLNAMIGLVNELKVDYEAHRILTAGSVHGAVDSTNVVTAISATDLDTAITLANDIKTQYEAHRVLIAGSVHGAADSTNVVTAADATDLGTLVTLAKDLKTQYEAHRVLTAGSVHGAADSTNVVLAETDSVEIYSDTYGTSSSIEIVSGSGSILTKIGHAIATTSGSGDVANIDAVTFTEAKTVIEADVTDSLLTLDGSNPRLSSNSTNTGSSSIIQVTGGTANTVFGFDTSAHDGADADARIAVTCAYTTSTSIAANVTVDRQVTCTPCEAVDIYASTQTGSGLVTVTSKEIIV